MTKKKVYKVGDDGQIKNCIGDWVPCSVTRVHANGTYRIVTWVGDLADVTADSIAPRASV